MNERYFKHDEQTQKSFVVKIIYFQLILLMFLVSVFALSNILISLSLSSIDRRFFCCGFLIIHFSAALRPFVIHSNNNKKSDNNDEEQNEQVHNNLHNLLSAQTITLGIGFILHKSQISKTTSMWKILSFGRGKKKQPYSRGRPSFFDGFGYPSFVPVPPSKSSRTDYPDDGKLPSLRTSGG